MADAPADSTSEYQRGWAAALSAAQYWHQAQAKKLLVQARRSRFPKNLELEAGTHQKAAELIVLISPDDV